MGNHAPHAHCWIPGLATGVPSNWQTLSHEYGAGRVNRTPPVSPRAREPRRPRIWSRRWRARRRISVSAFRRAGLSHGGDRDDSPIARSRTCPVSRSFRVSSRASVGKLECGEGLRRGSARYRVDLD